MAYFKKSFWHKYEDLSSDSQHPGKGQAWHLLVTPALRETETGGTLQLFDLTS